MKTQQNNDIERDIAGGGMILKPELGEKWHICQHPTNPGWLRLLPGDKCETPKVDELDEDGKATGKQVDAPKNGKEIECAGQSLSKIGGAAREKVKKQQDQAFDTMRRNMLDLGLGQQGAATLVDNTGKVVDIAALPTSFRPDEQARPAEKARREGRFDEVGTKSGAVTDADVKAAGEPPAEMFAGLSDAEKEAARGKHGKSHR